MVALLQRATDMFLEGLGCPRAAAKDGAAAPLINLLLVNAKEAIDELWKGRGYTKLRPVELEQRLGYKLDREEAVGYVLTSALNLPLLAPSEARAVGKRVGSMIGSKGSVGKQLAVLKKRGKSTDALLQAPAALSLAPPPRTASTSASARADASASIDASASASASANTSASAWCEPPAESADACDSEDSSEDLEGWPEGSRGFPGYAEALTWDTRKPPVVPSDERPEHLFTSRVVAKAVAAADWLERKLPGPDGHEYDCEEESEQEARKKYAYAIRVLQETYPELQPGPADVALLNVSRQESRPCACGHGHLARWPWVVQHDSLGFCDCNMAIYELCAWRSEWIQAGAPGLAW